jgi:hypothetical protein
MRRDDWLVRFAAIATLLLAPFCTTLAAAPQMKNAAPGYYRMMLGEFEVTVLSDGTVDLEIVKA